MTTVTTDFDAWLDANEPDNPIELYALYEAVSEITDATLYSAIMKGDRIFVSGPAGTTLLLASAKAHQAFLRRVEGLNRDPDLDIDEAADFWRAIENPNS